MLQQRRNGMHLVCSPYTTQIVVGAGQTATRLGVPQVSGVLVSFRRNIQLFHTVAEDAAGRAEDFRGAGLDATGAAKGVFDELAFEFVHGFFEGESTGLEGTEEVVGVEFFWQEFRAAREPFFEARKAARRQAGRPGGGRQGSRRDSAGSSQRRGSRPQGSLHASLAEIVGPLRDLFPEKRESGTGKKTGRKE